MHYKLTEQEINNYRPKPFFFVNTCDMSDLTLEKVEESLTELKECGFGGFILFNKPPVGFIGKDYLSENWFEMARNFAVSAKKLGLQMWINDGYDYPPGNVGGRMAEVDPTLKQQRIVMENGKPTVKEVDWGFPAFENPNTSTNFTRLVYDEYEKHMGEFFGDSVVGFFSDGDNRRVLPPVMFSEDHPCRNYFPWCVDFEESFSAAYGYDIMPYMERIMNRESIPQAIDYWEHAGHMYQRWFKGNSEWMKKHGLLYTGHTSDSSPLLYKDAPRSSALTEGRFSDIQSIFDYPGTDQELLALDGGKHMCVKNWYSPVAVWGGGIPEKMTGYYDVTEDTRAKQAGSTAYMYGKKEVMCEMFAASNFAVSPRELKAISTFQIMQGVTMVVPHAYHYRFCGPIKYFAPPEFSKRGMIGNYVKRLNTEIAELTAMMSKGESICPIALLDPTEAVWLNTLDSSKYLNTFASLNRLPYGYVICDAKKALEMDFKAVIVSGFKLDEGVIEAFKQKGIAVLNGDELEKLKDIVTCDICFEGEGTPHFVRKNIDGEEFVFVANVENEANVKGTLFAYGRQKQIDLPNGEVIYMSKTYDNIDEFIKGEFVTALPDEAEVLFGDDNIIPLERFEDSDYTAITKAAEDTILFFEFESKKELSDVELYIPKTHMEVQVVFNGEVEGFKDSKVYDDDYLVARLNVKKGNNLLEIHKSDSFRSFDRIFIKGDFDVDVKVSGKEEQTAFSVYNLSVVIPEKATVILKERSKKLSISRSWAEQYQPFYSGWTEYSFNIELKKGKYRLTLPSVRDVAKVYINGTLVGERIKTPYVFEFDGIDGKNKITVSVANSLGNAFECYKEDSGILSGGYIEKL